MALNIFDIQSLPRWHEGRVMLIGDAAHAVSPNAGQGASLALEDAMYLAKLLRDCSNYATAFACFERDRKPRVERTQAGRGTRGLRVCCHCFDKLSKRPLRKVDHGPPPKSGCGCRHNQQRNLRR
jgi:2-polyprenyl-6-methoxyphenol hydroxylase-like FAD-dependent oxidoreductase